VREPEKFGVIKNTSVPVEKLREIGAKLTDIPEDFNVHPLLKRIFKARRESLDTGKKIDMATAEVITKRSFVSLI
jgi:2-oxoglutarate dehydrogenase E1 component